MCGVPVQLREAVKQRLAAAAEEIFELLEKTIAEYEEETERQRQSLLEQLLHTRGQAQGLKPGSEEVKTEETWTPPLPQDQTQDYPPHTQDHAQDYPPHTQDHTQDYPPHTKNHTQNHSHTYSHNQTESHSQNHTPPLPHNQTRDWPESTHCQYQNSSPHSRPLDNRTLAWPEAAPLSPTGGTLRHFCSFCAKGFRVEWQLKRHMRVHTGERPFSCSFCGRSFSRKDALRGHVTIHTGRAPVGDGTKTCQICGKTFRSGNHLRRHMTVHTGEKPFSCSVCGRSFSRAESLRKHMDIHAAGNESSTANQPSGGSKRAPCLTPSPHHTTPSTQ